MTDAELSQDREWVIKDLKAGKVWSNDYGSFQGYSVALQDFGEPVKLNRTAPVTNEPFVGEVIYGHLDLEGDSGSGRSYWRFQGAPRGVIDGTHQLAKQPEADTPGDDPRKLPYDPEAVAAVQMAVEVWNQDTTGETASYDNIENEAKHFYNIIQRIKQ